MPIIFLKTQNSFEKNNITRDNNLRTLLLAFIAIFFVAAIIIPTPSMAVHKGAGDLVCGQCHTMHSSQGGTNESLPENNSMGQLNGSFLLLRGSQTSRADIHKLCLQCHSQVGSQATNGFQPHSQYAPKVHGGGTLSWDMSKSFGEIGAGGDFAYELNNSFELTSSGLTNALGYGHSVGLPSASPPGNKYNPTFTLTCTSCHDPHGVRENTWNGALSVPYGVNVYRNLVIMRDLGDSPACATCHDLDIIQPNAPGELWQMDSWIGGIKGTFPTGNFTPSYSNGVAIWPVYNPAAPDQDNVYDGISDNSADQTTIDDTFTQDGGMGHWCARCHPKMHEGTPSGAGNGPTAVGGGDWFRHPADYVIRDDDKSGANIDTIDWSHYNGIQAGDKVPAANTNPAFSTASAAYYADADNEDKVFCLSCHFAHGGPYYDALRWNYTSSVNPGEQDGNSVPSNRGCQQCHNR